jgi:hypothetical protein
MLHTSSCSCSHFIRSAARISLRASRFNDAGSDAAGVSTSNDAQPLRPLASGLDILPFPVVSNVLARRGDRELPPADCASTEGSIVNTGLCPVTTFANRNDCRRDGTLATISAELILTRRESATLALSAKLPATLPPNGAADISLGCARSTALTPSDVLSSVRLRSGTLAGEIALAPCTQNKSRKTKA